jgi:hypothetical protein
MEAFEDAPPYANLERLICQWRRHEAETREVCNLEAIQTDYPGCFPIARESRRRNLRRQASRPDFQTAFDVFDHNARNEDTAKQIEMDPENWDPAEMDDDEWEDWIQGHHRHLIENEHLEWFNYFLMLDVRTEYYFRYEGTQTIPPCYGPHTPFSRGNTTHWRVMKDPIRVHPRQIQEMERLIRERIASPSEGDDFRCQPDTAAEVLPDGRISVARPVQEFTNAHAMTFCECKDWKSKWPEDREWCGIQDINERFYETPYNFRTQGL